MNRLSFLKKLSVGIAAAVITPKVLIPSQKAVLTTGGVIPHIAKAGRGKYYGIFVAKSRRSGMSYINSLLIDNELYKRYEDLSFYDFVKMQSAIPKLDGLEGFKKKYQ